MLLFKGCHLTAGVGCCRRHRLDNGSGEHALLSVFYMPRFLRLKLNHEKKRRNLGNRAFGSVQELLAGHLPDRRPAAGEDRDGGNDIQILNHVQDEVRGNKVAVMNRLGYEFLRRLR
ncbi:MAG: hypothetical protein H6917_13715 [Novosphingobium sp.]|nr:hypothetical protein [Novosphingobium sp.]MCP5403427.1 hypothetical protein [Novosphingobium sp.]